MKNKGEAPIESRLGVRRVKQDIYFAGADSLGILGMAHGGGPRTFLQWSFSYADDGCAK